MYLHRIDVYFIPLVRSPVLRPIFVENFSGRSKQVLLCYFSLQYSSEEEEEDLESAMAGLKEKKRKELMAVDHTRIYYRPFKKDFYVEIPELARMTPEGTDSLYNL